jgi:phospholipid N-methyltransferase
MDMLSETMTYLKTFIRDRNVASITPTSPFGVKRVCSQINFEEGKLIVEYGPGTGVFSSFMLKNMPRDSRLILIERNKDFKAILEKNFVDPRVVIVNDSAENVLETLQEHSTCEADYVLSGIPFLFLSAELKARILRNTFNALKKGGKFLVYQTCFQRNGDLKVHLEKFFPRVTSRYEFMNIPPLRIYEAVK